MNESMADLQDLLMRLHKRLRARLEETEDEADRKALLTEMAEVTHRIQLAGGLLFAAQAQELETRVAAVRKGTKAVNSAIAEFEGLKSFLDSMKGFLSLVDEAIDAAKSLAG